MQSPADRRPDHLPPDEAGGAMGPAAIGRHVGVAVLAAIIVAALFNAFGQASETERDTGEAAELTVTGPMRIRGGLERQLLVAVTAREPIAAPRIVLAEGWYDRISLAVIVPQPEAQAVEPRSLVLAYPPLAAGARLEVRVTLEVNPAIRVGPRDLSVRVRDGDRVIAAVPADGVVFP